ncbi:Hypothetical_protein [Hexamita inflata]|uniref:Hypothetical_protein n=1 Tax=Hexamita inflata TaxID=28002 RepID=A0AA86PPF1_9EUKA|nr:Hypothetical protein HINF_LOCUS29951 [Hexamita inflata]
MFVKSMQAKSFNIISLKQQFRKDTFFADHCTYLASIRAVYGRRSTFEFQNWVFSKQNYQILQQFSRQLQTETYQFKIKMIKMTFFRYYYQNSEQIQRNFQTSSRLFYIALVAVQKKYMSLNLQYAVKIYTSYYSYINQCATMYYHYNIME